jgi:hypothetical protein
MSRNRSRSKALNGGYPMKRRHMPAETSNGTFSKLALSVYFFCISLEVSDQFASFRCGLRQIEQASSPDLAFISPAE